MTLPAAELLRRLGRGESIAQVCAAAGLSRPDFDAWWLQECRRRVPTASGTRRCRGLEGTARITRDRFGVPTVCAASDAELFFGLGYATAQDRLFQLDWLRRKARGRLAEILGPEAIASDLLARTVDLPGIAEREGAALPGAVRSLLEAYTAGVNALIDATRDEPAIEFDLLDYRPEPWLPTDSLAILGEFRWYLTGRFPVIVVPELVKRTFGANPLYRAFLPGEADDESILHRGDYPAGRRSDRVEGGAGEHAPGSNNWVLAGTRTASGKPLLASDPHVPFAAVSIWHQVRLIGGSFRAVGVTLAGTPAIMLGRNADVAWGITNNICSQRDLYQEKTDPAHPGCFLFDGRWEPARERAEVIAVRDAEPIRTVIRSSRNGPIVDEVLPAAARQTGPVALRWLGAEPCGWLTAMLDMNRARSAAEFREALRPWLVPTFCVVFADRAGHVGYQAAGRIPRRHVPERGYRPGWEQVHQWDGVLSFEEMPHLDDPTRGYVITANNRVAADDFPQPLSGTWSSGHRARRLRELIAPRSNITAAECHTLQLDCHSGRAATGVPHLLRALAEQRDATLRRAADLLAGWDGRMRADSVPAAIWSVFFARWCHRVAADNFKPEAAALVAGYDAAMAARLLEGDPLGWFDRADCGESIVETFRATLDELARRLGPTLDDWQWGRLHTLVQKHFLSGRGDLGVLLDRSGLPVDGDSTTVNASIPDGEHRAWLGAGYRMVADLSDPRAGLWWVEVGGVSGHPGSPHYDDQGAVWAAGQGQYTPLQGEDAADVATLVLEQGAR